MQWAAIRTAVPGGRHRDALCSALLSGTPPLTGVTCSVGLHVGSVWDMTSLPLEKHYLKNTLTVFMLCQPWPVTDTHACLSN